MCRFGIQTGEGYSLAWLRHPVRDAIAPAPVMRGLLVSGRILRGLVRFVEDEAVRILRDCSTSKRRLPDSPIEARWLSRVAAMNSLLCSADMDMNQCDVHDAPPVTALNLPVCCRKCNECRRICQGRRWTTRVSREGSDDPESNDRAGDPQALSGVGWRSSVNRGMPIFARPRRISAMSPNIDCTAAGAVAGGAAGCCHDRPAAAHRQQPSCSI